MRHSSPWVTPIEALVRGLRARISCIQALAFTTHFEEMVLYGVPVNHDEQQTPGHSTRLASEPMLGGHVSLVGIAAYEPWQQSFAWQRTGRSRSITKRVISHMRALTRIYTTSYSYVQSIGSIDPSFFVLLQIQPAGRYAVKTNQHYG